MIRNELSVTVPDPGETQTGEAVAVHEADPWKVETDYVHLFSGYGSMRTWFSHHLLRALSKVRWLPPGLATVALRLSEQELLETLRGCDPDVVRSFGVTWNRQLVRLLQRRHPEWVAASEVLRFKRMDQNAVSGTKVSIVLPTLNGTRYLTQAIESCLSQTHRNIELIVVDDGSGPEVEAIVGRYRSDPRLRYERHHLNRGVGESLNTGFRLATGSHLTWTSDDNYYEPHAIEEMLSYLGRYPDVDFVYAESYEVTDSGAATRLIRPGPPSSLRINNFVGACFLYKRHVYEKVGDYKPLPLVEDYDYWIRVARAFRMQRLFKTLYFYRAHPASLTGRHSWREVDERVTHIKRLNRFGSRRNR
ncbi:MAG: glycosyltransferase [Acidobacteriota bacterium]|nr:glycosyltransferase [Acidobacteriota bacterium]